jgi:hypothetical protein
LPDPTSDAAFEVFFSFVVIGLPLPELGPADNTHSSAAEVSKNLVVRNDFAGHGLSPGEASTIKG